MHFDVAEVPPVVTHHEVRVDGRLMRYTATAGRLPIKDAEKTDKRNKLRDKLTAHMDETQKTELLAMTDAVALTHDPVSKDEPTQG